MYHTFVYFTPSSLELYSLLHLVAFYWLTGYSELPYLHFSFLFSRTPFFVQRPFHPLCVSGWCGGAGIIICCDILAFSVAGNLACIKLKDPIPQYAEVTTQMVVQACSNYARQAYSNQARQAYSNQLTLCDCLEVAWPKKLDSLSVSGIPAERLKFPTKFQKTTENR